MCMMAEMGLTTKDWRKSAATVCGDGGTVRMLRGRVLETMRADKRSPWRLKRSLYSGPGHMAVSAAVRRRLKGPIVDEIG